jgi:hypothetical protein
MKWGIETKVPVFYAEALNGTVDFWSYENGLLTVLDYKSGRNPVDPEKNPQLLTYAAGLIEKLGCTPTRIRVGILQPFSGGFLGREPKWWECTPFDLEAFKYEAMMLARMAADPFVHAPLIPSDSACKYCAAKPHCPAIEEKLRQELAPGTSTELLTQEQHFAIMARAEVFRGFLDAVEEVVKELPDHVLEQHGWRMKRGARRFEWKLPQDELIAALEKLAVEPYKQVLKTPSMVRDELGGDKPIEDLVETKFNKSSLVRKKGK